ncbi:MAG: S8 family serine peptidase [Nocardioidaceae bacterium]
MNPRRLKRRGWAALVAVTAAATALSTSPSASAAGDPRPAKEAPTVAPHRVDLRKGDFRLDRASNARQTVFVQFSGAGAADVASRTGSSKAAQDRAAAVERQAGTVLAAARRADSKASRVFVTTNALPGIAVTTDGAGLRALAARSDVVKVSRITPRTLSNSNTASLVKALATWKSYGNTGAGVDIGVIDSGIDWTHADFGGVGTPEAYAAADGTDPAWRDSLPALGKAKIKGGWDFAGDDYNADDPLSSPDPDNNPLDCGGHGTHVAGTAAGYGVTAGGGTFSGGYGSLTADKLMKMRVGPGMAPKANLYSLKVFGCEGSTNLVIPAMDWALDPNGDGDFSDHLDIVNMSLGSNYGRADDADSAFVDELSSHGVLSVISAGNDNDLTDILGSPGAAVSALTVASSVDAYQQRDAITVNAPAGVAGQAVGQFSVAYDWANNGPSGDPVTGDVAAIPGDNADGCAPLSDEDAAKVDGKVAWLVWDDNDATRRCGSVARSGNVKAAGAIGAIFTSELEVFGAGITGDSEIPVIQLPGSEVARLQDAVDAGTLNVTFDGDLQGAVKDVNPAISDTISSFTSRGGPGTSGVVKPDVAAPGDTIASAGIGTGNGFLVESGTSMAAPLSTGVSALVKAAHPSWSPLQVKAAIMNNAGHDLWTGTNKSGTRYAPARVGSGRIDAKAAVSTTLLAYVNNPANAVSASFGVVPAPVTSGTVTKTRQLVVQNTGSKKATVSLSYESVNSSPGVSYSVTPSSLTIGAGKKATATVKMTVRPTQLRHTIDKTMAKNQYLGSSQLPRQFISDSSGRLLVASDSGKLRVPVYGAAKPVSTTTASYDDGQIVMSGSGVDQGAGATAYKSFASVMQLGAKSGTLPECTLGEDPVGCTTTASERGGDIKAVGAGATDDWLWFGVSTHGDFANTGTVMVPYVDFDVNGDDEPDFETYVQPWTDTDLYMAFTVDLESGDLVELEPVNFNFGDVDTNVFDTNVVLMPIGKEWIGLPTDGTSAPITYSVGMFNAYTGADLDHVDATGSFDAGAPALSTAGPLYRDAGGTAIDITNNGAEQALVFHLDGGTGARDEVVDLPAPLR